MTSDNRHREPGASTSEAFTTREVTTLPSSVSPDLSVRREVVDVEVVPPPETLATRLAHVEQRLGTVETRIDGLYERLTEIERGRADQEEERQSRSNKLLLLWVGLFVLFAVIWVFLGPRRTP
jgi:hypothetical protein